MGTTSAGREPLKAEHRASWMTPAKMVPSQERSFNEVVHLKKSLKDDQRALTVEIVDA
jgi:hypothetical protein